jgi:hypothetical protein
MEKLCVRAGFLTVRLGQQNRTMQDAQKVRPARPQRVKARGVPLRYVEGLNDARTPLEGFFNILLTFSLPETVAR